MIGSNHRYRSVIEDVRWPAILSNRGAHLLALLDQMRFSEVLTQAAMCELQVEQAGALLRHAVASVPFYRGRERQYHLPSTCLTAEAFRQLPLLDRATIQQQGVAMYSEGVPSSHGKLLERHTSGSTGRPLRCIGTDLTSLIWDAQTLRDHLWHQRDFSLKLAVIRTQMDRRRESRWAGSAGEVFETGLSASLDIATDLEEQLNWLVAENPAYLLTHPSNLGALAKLSLERGIRPTALRQARTFGEALRDDLRDTVRRAWQVNIADLYSSEECGYMALQCPSGHHYHVQAESVLIEVLDDSGKPCGPGETGRVVVTTLQNYAMPLVRYESGDYAEVGSSCSCGRTLPVLTRIHGRQRNMVMLPDGRSHWPSFPADMWLSVAPVEQFRLVQRDSMEIEINYVMSYEMADDEKKRLEDLLAARFGYRFRFEWVRREAIPHGANYKFEDFVSELGMDGFKRSTR